MILTPWIEPLPAPRTLASTPHVLVNTENVLASSTENSALVSRALGPHSRLVRFARIVAADACVELLAAEMLDGDYVKWGVPVGALG